MGAGVTQENGLAAALFGRPPPPGFTQWVVADTSGRGTMPARQPPCPDARPADAGEPAGSPSSTSKDTEGHVSRLRLALGSGTADILVDLDPPRVEISSALETQMSCLDQGGAAARDLWGFLGAEGLTVTCVRRTLPVGAVWAV